MGGSSLLLKLGLSNATTDTFFRADKARQEDYNFLGRQIIIIFEMGEKRLLEYMNWGEQI